MSCAAAAAALQRAAVLTARGGTSRLKAGSSALFASVLRKVCSHHAGFSSVAPTGGASAGGASVASLARASRGATATVTALAPRPPQAAAAARAAARSGVGGPSPWFSAKSSCSSEIAETGVRELSDERLASESLSTIARAMAKAAGRASSEDELAAARSDAALSLKVAHPTGLA